MLWEILLLVLIALVMYFVAKFVPATQKIADWILIAYLFGMFIKLQGFGQITDLVDQIPYLSYILVFPLGVMLGKEVAKYI